jgi:hypothetical protein
MSEYILWQIMLTYVWFCMLNILVFQMEAIKLNELCILYIFSYFNLYL